MTLKQCFHADEKPAEHRVPRRKTTTQDLAERPCKCIWQRTMKTYLSGIKHRREQPQHGQACEVLLLSINKWSSQNNKLNMHQWGHPGTLRDTKGSGSLKWRHYYQTIHEVCRPPLSISTLTSEKDNVLWTCSALSHLQTCHLQSLERD